MKGFYPYVREKSVRDNTKWSAVFKFDKRSNQPRVNLIRIRTNSLVLSDAPIRLAQVMSGSPIISLIAADLSFRAFRWIRVSNKLPSPFANEYTLHFLILLVFLE